MSAAWIPISDGRMAECPECGETYVIDGHDGAEGFAKFCARNRYCHRCGAEITEEPKQTAWISTDAMLPPEGQEEREKMRRGEIDDPVRLGWSFEDCAPSVILAAFALRPKKKKEEERADDTGDD